MDGNYGVKANGTPAVPTIRVTDRDREAAVGMLQTAYAAGRLDRDEHDARVTQALTARSYAQLDTLTSDLPGRAAYPDQPVPRRTNGLAVAALACGIAQPFTGMLSTIPAIVLGHIARRQIRETGDRGGSVAAWGLALGWAGLATAVAVIALLTWVIIIAAHAAHGS